MKYTDKQILILKELVAGESIKTAASNNGFTYKAARALVFRFRKTNNLTRQKDFDFFLKNAILPTKIIRKKKQCVYQTPSGAWSARAYINGVWRRLGNFVTEQQALERREKILANPELLGEIKRRTLPPGIYAHRGHYMIKAWVDGKQIYVGTRKTLDDAIQLQLNARKVKRGTPVPK